MAEKEINSILLDMVDSLLVVCDGEGRVLRFGKACVALTGVAEAEAQGRFFWELFTPASESLRVRRGIEKLRAGRPELEFEANWTAGDRGPVRVAWRVRAGGNELVALGQPVTERFGKAWQEADPRVRLAIQAGRMGTWGRNLLTGEDVWSDREEMLFGLEAGQFHRTHMSFLEMVHPDDRTAVEESSRRAIEEKTMYESEYRIIRPDGSVRWMAGRGDIIRDPNGRATHMVGVTIDITELKRVEQELRHSEAVYRTFLLQSSEGIWRFEAEEPIPINLSEDEQIELFYRHNYLAECNDAMARMYGFDRAEEIVGARLGDLCPRSDPRNIEFHRAFIRSGYNLKDAESHEVDKFGRPKYFLNNLVGTIENGRFIRVWGTQRDITDRKQAEQSLERSREMLELAQEVASIGTFEWQIQTGRVEFTREFEALYGLPPGGAGENFDNWASSVHPDDRERARAEADRAVVEGELNTEFRVVWPDGSVHWLSARARVFPDSEGRPLRMVGVNIDITERKRAEAERDRLLTSEQMARREAEKASKAKDDFLAVLSHELRTPLTPVLLTVSMMEKESRLPADVLAEVRGIRRNVELEARLIDDLLDLTRISRGKLQLAYQTVDVHELLQRVVEICHREDGVSTHMRLGARRHHVRADPARLQQVFWNLLSNAHKFTPVGGSITVRTEEGAGGRLVVEVTDTGLGIAPEVLPRIFGAFEQGDSGTARKFGGLGLGLAISKRLVDAHGGKLSASSEGPGRGATFRVEMPIVEPVMRNGGQIGRSGGEERSARALRILLVEDHEGTRQVMAKLLASLGHTPTAAGGVQEALRRAEGSRFDLVIGDLGLPDGSGHELMRELAARYGLAGIALSGYGMEDDVRRSHEAGFAEHLTKPIDLAKLEATIERVADGLAQKAAT